MYRINCGYYTYDEWVCYIRSKYDDIYILDLKVIIRILN